MWVLVRICKDRTLSPNPDPRQVVREDAARVQELLRSQASELVASQMLVSRLEAPTARPDTSTQQQELDDLHRQLQVRFSPLRWSVEQGCVITSVDGSLPDRLAVHPR